MARTFKALSALLTYPTAELKAAAAEIRYVIAAEGLVPARDRAALEVLVGEIATRDLYDLQERYTLLFDRSRSLSLHLFEHVHGESRDRGQAMVDLAAHYEKHGFFVRANELPDFLPLFLEFLSQIPDEEARDLVAEPVEVLRALEQRLARRRSPYAAVFRVLVTLAGGQWANARDVAWSDEADVEWAGGDPDDLAALDAEWEEAAVRFGPEDPAGDACGRSRLMTRLRAEARKVTGSGAEARKATNPGAEARKVTSQGAEARKATNPRAQ